MQKTSKDIVKAVHAKYPQYSEDLLMKLNNFLFKTLQAKISEGKTLLYLLNPLGTFSFRRKATEDYLKLQPPSNLENPSEFISSLLRVSDQYKVYVEDKLKLKYEKFGKESHEAYLLAKKAQRAKKYQARQRKNNS